MAIYKAIMDTVYENCLVHEGGLIEAAEGLKHKCFQMVEGDPKPKTREKAENLKQASEGNKS